MSTTVSPGNFDKLSLRLKMKAKETYSYVRQNAEKSKIQKKHQLQSSLLSQCLYLSTCHVTVSVRITPRIGRLDRMAIRLCQHPSKACEHGN